MIVTIHQPEHLVWLGLIKKISDSDVFVILDSVQFEKNYFQNRNKIRTKEGWMWLTVPVKKASLSTSIKDIEISYNENWQKKYLKSLQIHYGKTPFFKTYYPKIEEIVLKNHTHLADLNIELLEWILKEFGVENKKIVKSSSLGIEEGIGGSNVCLEVCKYFKPHVYLAGPSGRDYLILDDFKQHCIDVHFHDFSHPEYTQIHGSFLPYMSSLDALFNLGDEVKGLF